MRNPVLERLQKYGLQPRKELGQHFLIDPNSLDRLERLIEPRPGQLIVEFGAGIGVLTERLLAAGARVVAVELDDALARVLEEELRPYEDFTLVHADLARVDTRDLLQQIGGSRLTLAGNLPYQLTSRVLFGLLDLQELLEEAVFMVQREVAERIVAPPGSRHYGILSVLLGTWFDVHVAARLKPGAFLPPPRVESAILHIEPRAAGPAVEWSACEALVRLVKSVFNERRKVLRNTLKKFYGLDAQALESCARASGLDLGRRPESLSVDEFVHLLRALPASSIAEA